MIRGHHISDWNPEGSTIGIPLYNEIVRAVTTHFPIS